MTPVVVSSAIRIEVLGPILVRGDGAIAVERPFQRRLLAMLAMRHGRTISSDTLSDWLWGTHQPKTAKASLHTHVSGLRKSLGKDIVETVRDGYRLANTGVEVDATDFERMVGEMVGLADAQDWPRLVDVADEALAMWRGRAFAEIADEHFAIAGAVKLEEMKIEVHEMRAAAFLRQGRPEQVLADLEALVVEHPYRERLWESLIDARFRLGRNMEAVRAFETVSENLAEIGLTPGPRLRRLEDRILSNEASDEDIPNNLTADLTTFIGREAEIEAAGLLLGENRIVTLTGPGGSGKTRLALRVARYVKADHPDGVWIVELGPLRDADAIPIQIANALGLQPRGEDVMEVVAGALKSSRSLIVLDNCEHMIDQTVDAVMKLLGISEHLSILATSRELLGVPGEAVFEVPGLLLPSEEARSPSIQSSEAVDLFEQRARQVDPEFEISEENLRDVVRICRHLDGMPLAIELAAARARSLAPSVIAEHLRDRISLLSSGSAAAPPRHRTLYATIDWSYRLLDNTERAVLNRLTVFRGGFTLRAAANVVAGAGIDPAELPLYLSRLVEKSLVSRYRKGNAERYRMLETVRQFAKERSRETTHMNTTREQHFEWFVGQIDPLWSRAIAGGNEDLLTVLDNDSENLEEALEWSRQGGDRRSEALLVGALGWHWYLRGQLAKAASVIGDVTDELWSERDRSLNGALLARSHAYAEAVDLAIDEARRAHAHVEDIEDHFEAIWVLATLNLALLMSAGADPKEMLILAEQAEQRARKSNSAAARVLADQVGADALSWNGSHSEALHKQRDALDLVRETGSKTLVNDVYGASIYNYMLSPGQRGTQPTAILEEWESLGTIDRRAWESVATDWVPWIHMQSGNLDEAENALERIGRRTMEGYNRSIYLMGKSSIAWMRGELEDARRFIVELENNLASLRWIHAIFPQFGEILADLRQPGEVGDIAERYLRIAVHSSREALKLGVLAPLVRAEVDAALDAKPGRDDRARTALERMESIFERHPPPYGGSTALSTPLQSLVMARAELSRLGAPNPSLWSEVARNADYAYYRLYARWRQGEALLAVGDSDKGVPLLENVAEGAERMGASLMLSRARATQAT